MSKVTMTFEDVGGNVKVEMSPTAETLIQKIASHGPDSLTSAEAYAMAAANRVRSLSKQPGRIITAVPAIGRK